MDDVNLIVCIRELRKLVTTLDSIGMPIKQFVSDNELKEYVPKNLLNEIKDVSSKVHVMLQTIEKTKKYRGAILTICDVKERLQ